MVMIHVLGSGLWLGGLFLLAFLALRAGVTEESAAALRKAVRAFRAPGLTAIALQLVSGMHLAARYMKGGANHWFAFDTKLSAHVSLKIYLLLLSIALALFLGFWSSRPVSSGRLRGTTWILALLSLLLVVLGVNLRF